MTQPDSRKYVRMTIDLPETGARLGLSTAAKWMHAVSICVAGRDLSNGHVRPRVVAAEADVPEKTGAALVTVGRWHEPGHDCKDCPQPVPGFVYVHHYLEHQRSKEEVDAMTTSARAGASRTNHGRYHKKKVEPDCYWCRSSDRSSEQEGDR